MRPPIRPLWRLRVFALCAGFAGAAGCFSPSGKDPGASTGEASSTGGSSGSTSGDATTATSIVPTTGPGTTTEASVGTDPGTTADSSTTDLTTATTGALETGTSSDGSTDATTMSAGACGDGLLDVGEQCDDGPNNANNAPCTKLCLTNICGDGLPCVACGQDCDDGNNIEGDGCSSACTLEFAYAFVTSGVWTGAAIGGVVGADMKCNTAANGSDLLKGRKFHAWLSKDDEDAAVHVGAGTRKLLRTDGETVAENSKALIDGKLNMPIDHDELGNLVAGPSPCMMEQNQVWTGTLADGTKAPELCSNWSAAGSSGRLGNFSEISSTWTDCRFDGCGILKAHLYCIEVDEP